MMRVLLVAIVFILTPVAGFADCSNPAGVEGEQVYNATEQLMQFCNGTDWTRMDGHGDNLWTPSGNVIYYQNVPTAVGTTSMNPADQQLLVDGKAAMGTAVSSGTAETATTVTQNVDIDQDIMIEILDDAGRNAIASPGTGQLIFNSDSSTLEIFNGIQWLELPSAAMPLGLSCKHILDDGQSTGDGVYLIDPDGTGGDDPFDVYCDMTTDGGGWTIFAAYTGADGEQPFVSNTEVLGGNPLSFQHYNINRAKKMAVSAVATETIFVRNNATWLKADAPAFDASLDTASTHTDVNVTLTASDLTTASGVMGYSNYNNASGGDFGVTNTSGFDRHSSSYYHLNNSCAGQYIYSYSNGSGDGDAGYDVQIGLGSWGTTISCDGGEGGALVFYAGMR